MQIEGIKAPHWLIPVHLNESMRFFKAKKCIFFIASVQRLPEIVFTTRPSAFIKTTRCGYFMLGTCIKFELAARF